MGGTEWRPEVLTTIAAPAIWACLLRIVICIGYVGAAIAKLIQFNASAAEFAGQYGLKHARTLLVVYIAVALIGSTLFISGWMLWLGAGALGVFTLIATIIAFPFWKQRGPARKGQLFAFLPHLSLASAFFLIAWYDLARPI